MSIEAMKQALEALDSKHDMTKAEWRVLQYRAFNALRAAIAEAAMQRLTDVQQEMDCYGDGNVYRGQRSSDSKTQTIRVQEPFPEKIWEVVPPRREWVGLTDEDHEAFCKRSNLHPVVAQALAEYLEAKLKERNS